MKFNNLLDVTLKSTNIINKWCEPLSALGITTFWKFNISKSGDLSYVTNNPYFAEHYFYNNLHEHNPFFKQPGIIKPGIFLSRAIKQNSYQKCLDLTAKNCNVDQSLILLNQTNDGVQGVGFATSSDQVMEQVYFNHLPILKKFSSYFDDEAHSLLVKVKEGSVNLKNLLGKKFIENPSCLESKLDSKQVDSFYAKILNLDPTHFVLTSREKDCLENLLKGLSSKEIAFKLNISPRTVEFHVENLKVKFNCESRLELISKLSLLNQYNY